MANSGFSFVVWETVPASRGLTPISSKHVSTTC